MIGQKFKILESGFVLYICLTICYCAQPAKVLSRSKRSTDEVYYLPGTNTTLQCFRSLTDAVIDSIDDCTWIQTNGPHFTEEELDINKQHDAFPQSGETKCSIVMKLEFEATWSCKYTLSGNEETVQYKLLPGEDMTDPVIYVNGEEAKEEVMINADSQITLKCNSTGRPIPSITLVYGGENTTNSKSAEIEVKPKREDDGASVMCEAKQVFDVIERKTTKITMNVLFAPSCESLDFNVNNGTLNLLFACQANPIITAYSWEFSESSNKEAKKNISENEEYKAQEMEHKEGNTYIFALTIKSGSNGDLKNCFYLTVENSNGKHTVEKCPEESGGGSGGVIAGILVAVGILIAILLAGILIYKKKIRSVYERTNSG